MRLFWVLIGIFVVGCGSKPPVTDGADSGSTADSGSVVIDSGNQETGDTEEPIVPEQGYYLGSVTGEVVNECGLEGMEDAAASPAEFWFELEGTSMSILMITDGTYSEGPHPCVFSDNTFSCVVLEETQAPSDMDAAATTMVAFKGEWTDANTIDARYEISLDCEGADCDEYLKQMDVTGTVPCVSSIGILAEWTEAEPVLPVKPEKGEYKATMSEVSADTCGVDKEDLQEFIDENVLYFDLDGGLNVRWEDRGREVGTYYCMLAGPGFDCPMQEERDQHSDYDAVLVQASNVSGAFTAPTELDGTLTLSWSCEGSQCAEALKQSPAPVPVPCELGFSFTGK